MTSLTVNNSRDAVNMSLLNEYTAGDSFKATCMITAYELDLSPPITTNAIINILHNNNTIKSTNVFDIGASGSHKPSLNISFTHLKLSQSGEYICSYIRNSSDSFVQESNVKSADNRLNIKSKLFIHSTSYLIFLNVIYTLVNSVSI